MDHDDQCSATADAGADDIKARAVDYLTAGLRAALGSVPGAGPLLAEIAGSVIPRQRIDRLVDFTTKLQERIAHLEMDAILPHLDNEEFTDLVEEALRQASRSTTEERRAYLASLVANSLSSEAIRHEESKHLMRLLGGLTDVEVLWLRYFASPGLDGDEEFRELHRDVLAPRFVAMEDPQEDVDAAALQRSYQDHLEQEGLITSRATIGNLGIPEFDYNGKVKTSFREASDLGHLLLRSIGLGVRA